jgi:hypothetical protein
MREQSQTITTVAFMYQQDYAPIGYDPITEWVETLMSDLSKVSDMHFYPMPT